MALPLARRSVGGGIGSVKAESVVDFARRAAMGGVCHTLDLHGLAHSRQTEGVFSDSGVFGNDLIVWILLALGGALFVGNVMALIRPPARPRQEGDLEQAPRGRSMAMAAVGFVVAIAALATLTR